jgi:hypothetical protein
MKINIFYKIIVSVALLASLYSCDYLNVVPDETTTIEDTWADADKARSYLYSCYGYLPNPAVSQSSLDQMTGDEVITAFEHESFAAFPKGNYSASNPVISYWNTFFQGIRQCYMFINSLDKVPDLSAELKADYIAQAKYLIAYYHYLMARCYGPIILVKTEPKWDTLPTDYQGREPYDDCVQWICDLLDEAAKGLPAIRTSQAEYGLATSTAAKAVKAKMLLYAASPLFNEQAPTLFANLKNPDGKALMPSAYDSNKWVKARDAIKEAIDFAEQNGYALYKTEDLQIGSQGKNQYPVAGKQRLLRFIGIDYVNNVNPEVILADTRGEGFYGLQNKSLPFVGNGLAWNGVGPTWAMLNRFYTKNGLPWDEDPEYSGKDKLSIVTIDADHADEGKQGKQTITFNLDREPRYYAWVAFQGGYFEVMNRSSKPAYAQSNGKKDNSEARIICDFVLGGNCSRGSVSNPRSGNYSPSGYLNKKFVDPNITVGTDGVDLKSYPYPVIRLADLYLAYAEACIECGSATDLSNAKKYINYVRERAGIPTVEDAWGKIGVELTQAKLRQIVRQERMVELYMECQNFWDMRRWMLGEQYFNVKAQGLNIAAKNISEFAKLTTIDFERKFTAPTQYLLPIPIDDINKNSNLVNNPGYTGDVR